MKGVVYNKYPCSINAMLDLYVFKGIQNHEGRRFTVKREREVGEFVDPGRMKNDN